METDGMEVGKWARWEVLMTWTQIKGVDITRRESFQDTFMWQEESPSCFPREELEERWALSKIKGESRWGGGNFSQSSSQLEYCSLWCYVHASAVDYFPILSLCLRLDQSEGVTGGTWPKAAGWRRRNTLPPALTQVWKERSKVESSQANGPLPFHVFRQKVTNSLPID